LPEDAYRYFPEGRVELRHAVPYPRSLLDPRFLVSMTSNLLRRPAVWSPWHNYRLWASFVEQHERRSSELEAKYEELERQDASPQDIWDTISRAQRLNAELLALHRWSLTCTDLSYSLLRRMVRAWAGGPQAMELCTRLVTGLPNRSAEMDRALNDLAAKEEGSVSYAEAMGAFLANYGHRSFYLDIYYPPLAAQPSQVEKLVQGLREQSGRVPGGQAATHQEARDELGAMVCRGLFGRLKWALLAHVLHLTQHYMPLREDQRFHWQRTLALMRKLFLLLGERMARTSVLNAQSQVLFLTKAELGAYVQGTQRGLDLAGIAAAREDEFARLCAESGAAPGRAYPPFLQGNHPLDTFGRAGDRGQFRGHGVSPGLARGRVRILRSADELSKVKSGDILVAPGVDSGWTPVFGLLKALVLEHGGQLSHAAVIAREYGLPAIAGIEGITQVLHDGDEVCVDGLNGWVYVLG